MAEACREVGFPAGLTAAILQENVALQACMRFRGQTETGWRPYTRCVATGSVEAPLLPKHWQRCQLARLF